MNHFFKKVLLIELGIFTGVGLICWLSGQFTIGSYINGLEIAGLILFGVGFLKVIGNWGATRDFSYQFVQTTNQENIDERVKRQVDEENRNYLALFSLSIMGAIPFLTGILLYYLFVK